MSNTQQLSQQLDSLRREEQQESSSLLRKKGELGQVSNKKLDIEYRIAQKTRELGAKKKRITQIKPDLEREESQLKERNTKQTELDNEKDHLGSSSKKVELKRSIESKRSEIKKRQFMIQKLTAEVETSQADIDKINIELGTYEKNEKIIQEKAIQLGKSGGGASLEQSVKTKKTESEHLESELVNQNTGLINLKDELKVVNEKIKTMTQEVSIFEDSIRDIKLRLTQTQGALESSIKAAGSQTRVSK